MNFSPGLDSLSHFRMLFFKLPRKFVHFSKEFAPSQNNRFVFHPLKLSKGHFFSTDPWNHNNWKVVLEMNEFILCLFQSFWHERTNMIQLMRSKVINEKYLIFDFLLAIVFRVRRNSDGKFVLSAVLINPGSFKCRILGCLNEFSQVDIPELFDNLGNFLMIEVNFGLKESHGKSFVWKRWIIESK